MILLHGAGQTAENLRDHGLLTVGGSVEEAAWWYLAMDRTCGVQLLAEAAGTPVLIEPASRGEEPDYLD